ncbi:MAG: DUF6133 family protein [Clostridia bacterium]|nr:DUF6133 family protein [Clostridia bacterium]
MKKILLKMAFKADEIKKKLKNNSGQGALDTAVIVLISIVLGALILAGLYALLDDTVMPELQRRITEMFNYTN